MWEGRKFIPEYIDFGDGVWLYVYVEWNGPSKHWPVRMLLTTEEAAQSMINCAKYSMEYSTIDANEYHWSVREKIRHKRKYKWVPERGVDIRANK